MGFQLGLEPLQQKCFIAVKLDGVGTFDDTSRCTMWREWWHKEERDAR